MSDARMRASASAQLRWHSGRLFAQVGWVAHFEACAERHEYELVNGLPVVPTVEELERSEWLDEVADRYFELAEARGFTGGTDAAFGEP
jgi:hypothetical protein